MAGSSLSKVIVPSLRATVCMTGAGDALRFPRHQRHVVFSRAAAHCEPVRRAASLRSSGGRFRLPSFFAATARTALSWRESADNNHKVYGSSPRGTILVSREASWSSGLRLLAEWNTHATPATTVTYLTRPWPSGQFHLGRSRGVPCARGCVSLSHVLSTVHSATVQDRVTIGQTSAWAHTPGQDRACDFHLARLTSEQLDHRCLEHRLHKRGVNKHFIPTY